MHKDKKINLLTENIVTDEEKLIQIQNDIINIYDELNRTILVNGGEAITLIFSLFYYKSIINLSLLKIDDVPYEQAPNLISGSIDLNDRLIKAGLTEESYVLFDSIAQPRISNKDLNKTIDHINTIEIEPDLLGPACERFINYYMSLISKSANRVDTPPDISELIAILMEPEKFDSIYDPLCGSGSLLIKCGNYIDKQLDFTREKLLYGQEKNLLLASITQVNMMVQTKAANSIRLENALVMSSLDQSKFDIAVSNLYFPSGKVHPVNLRSEFFGNNKYGLPPVTATNDDYLYILLMLEKMHDKSRMAVLVSHGVLFRGGKEGDVRQNLIEANLIDSIIALPDKIIYGKEKPVAILILKKLKNDTDILFINASHEFELINNKPTLSLANIKKISTSFKCRKALNKFAYLIPLEEIRKNSYNLNISRYTLENPEEMYQPTLMEVTGIHNEKLNSYKTAQKKLDELIFNTLRDNKL
jgi:type I restriction system adenine methylase HsdM